MFMIRRGGHMVLIVTWRNEDKKLDNTATGWERESTDFKKWEYLKLLTGLTIFTWLIEINWRLSQSGTWSSNTHMLDCLIIHQQIC